MRREWKEGRPPWLTSSMLRARLRMAEPEQGPQAPECVRAGGPVDKEKVGTGVLGRVGPSRLSTGLMLMPPSHREAL